MKTNELLLFISLKYQGDWESIYNFIERKEKFDQKEFDDVVKNFNGGYITIMDDDYPKIFKNCIKPPFVLYYKGNKELLNTEFNKMLAVIGSRNNSLYGKEMTNKIIKGLPNDIVIISGLAKGIDGIAHKVAVDSNKKTIAILGGGINYIYPKENESLYNEIIDKGGLIISEYPLNSEPKKENFLMRNRLIAALSKALFVAESYGRSGSSSTICFALQENRDVGCLPYRANDNSNCNKYIKDGAAMIESSEDILEILK